jgi:hypothetical protein
VNVGHGFVDVPTGEAAAANLALAPFDCRVLKRERPAE